MNKVVYIHRRKDNDTIFYVGMGSPKRVKSKSHRNNHWRNIVSKYGYYYEVVANELSQEDAYELEMFLIDELGRKDLGKGDLVNMTDGGDGCNNWNDARTKIMIEKNRKNMKSVSQYNSKGEFIKSYRSISEASKQSDIARQTIRDCVNGKLKTAGGFVWVLSDVEYNHNPNRFDKGSNAMKGGKNPNAKLVLNKETGIFYQSLSMAFKSQNKYKMSAFKAQVRGQNKNKTNFEYV
jgi:hypothetical protein